MDTYKTRLKDITTFIFDVDGVLTNSELIILENGQLLRKMHTRDGYAMKRAVQKGYHLCIITGGGSSGVVQRLKGLGITDIYLGAHNKIEQLDDYFNKKDIITLLMIVLVVFIGNFYLRC